MNEKNTTIKITKAIQKDLQALKKENETYSSVIRRLLDETINDNYDMTIKAYENVLYNMDLLPNIFTLEGVENLLTKNMFNEVPQLLIYASHSFFEFSWTAKTDEYSQDKYELYVKKVDMLLQRMSEFVKSEFFPKEDNTNPDAQNLRFVFGFYMKQLSNHCRDELFEKYESITNELM